MIETNDEPPSLFFHSNDSVGISHCFPCCFPSLLHLIRALLFFSFLTIIHFELFRIALFPAAAAAAEIHHPQCPKVSNASKASRKVDQVPKKQITA